MAIPKVFISSTCFDLSEIREQLSKFVSSFGFDPILSDHGDVFYHPDLHTHEACVHEVSNCQLFILIIGGRYGGSYTVDKTKSITNAEYEAAINHGIPVFTYIKKDVLSDHHIYTTNSKSEIANQITYPSITKQNDSLSIFNFINQVRRQNKNNSYEGFDNFGQIESHLRKQWAGMFFDFLRTKEIKSQIDATNHLLENLKSSNKKLEDIVKNLYINTSKDKELAQFQIDQIELSSKMFDFYNISLDVNLVGKDINKLKMKSAVELSKIIPNNNSWKEYLKKTSPLSIDYVDQDIDFNNEFEGIYIVIYNYRIDKFIDTDDISIIKSIYNKYICKSSEEQRLKFFKYFISSLNFDQN
ncbi:DUF4062 domain-containing protein [Marinomonas primoryensis]|uniref:DUF4062 domain-containing protein n=1 Tax=Marinomonas primoryensis TaxID=178399 RepID=A0ABV0L5S3_9GAMM